MANVEAQVLERRSYSCPVKSRAVFFPHAHVDAWTQHLAVSCILEVTSLPFATFQPSRVTVPFEHQNRGVHDRSAAASLGIAPVNFLYVFPGESSAY